MFNGHVIAANTQFTHETKNHMLGSKKILEITRK